MKAFSRLLPSAFCLLLSVVCLLTPAFGSTHVTGVYSVGASPAVMATVNGNSEYGLVFAQRNKSVTYSNILYVNNVVTAYFDINGNLNDGNGNQWIDLIPDANATPGDSYYVVTINIQGSVHSEIWIVPDQATVNVLSVRQTTASPSGGDTTPVFFYQTVQQTGTSLAQQPILNLTGAGVSCLDNSSLQRTDCTITGGSGTGPVTSFSAGTLAPLFTTSVATAATTPALSFSLSNAAAHQFFGNNTGGSAAPAFVQPAFTDLSGSVAASQLPNPSASTLGGIQSLAAVGSKWINTISTSGAPSATQPAFTDISGSVAASQLPSPSAMTLGGIQSLAAVSHKWINTISTSGVPSATQPASSDLSDAANLVMTSTTASGDLSGTYPGPTVAKVNGTSVPTNVAADQTIVTTASATGAWKAVNNCGDATHALSYSTGTHAFGCQAITATAAAGGSSGQVQWNNATALAGMTNLTTTGTITTALAGADWLFADPTDSTKKAQLDLSGIATATTRTITVANANSTTVVADAGAANNFLTSISATGVISKAQPAFTNISGSVAASQLPNPSASTLGGIESITCAGSNFVNSISISGVPGCATPAGSGTVTTSGSPVANQVSYFTSATAITGTTTDTTTTHALFATATAPAFRALAGSDLPNPSASTLGGIESLAAAGSKWINQVSISGVPSATQPAFTDISGISTKGQAPATDVYTDQSNAFTTGTQDLSGATATIPIKATTTAGAPATCTANKEYLTKTDATTGQQLFICNATGNGWNLVGDGGSGGGANTALSNLASVAINAGLLFGADNTNDIGATGATRPRTGYFGTSVNVEGTGAGLFNSTEGAAPSCAASHDLLWGDSTAHRLNMCNNNGSPKQVVASGVDINTDDQVTATHLTADLPVAQGGTSLGTLTVHALYVGNTTSAPTALAVGATNTLLHGNTTADPSFSAIANADLGSASYVKGILSGGCSGTATAKTTVFMFGLGENSAFTCTVATATLGVPMATAGTIKNLYVYSSANGKGAGTVITVDKNAGTTTVTCSMSGVTTCSDLTHSFTYVAGDKITVQLATASAETIANVIVSIETWN